MENQLFRRVPRSSPEITGASPTMSNLIVLFMHEPANTDVAPRRYEHFVARS